jgi:succinate dehydrogenase / fumarate reductase membrane anchor subunit
MVERVVTGAHYGLTSWLLQRMSAIVLACYALFMAGWLLAHPRPDYAAWTGLYSASAMRSFTLLVLLALFLHAWVGVRDTVMDYVKPTWLRLLLYVLVILALILYAIWSVQILWGIR